MFSILSWSKVFTSLYREWDKNLMVEEGPMRYGVNRTALWGYCLRNPSPRKKDKGDRDPAGGLTLSLRRPTLGHLLGDYYYTVGYTPRHG